MNNKIKKVERERKEREIIYGINVVRPQRPTSTMESP